MADDLKIEQRHRDAALRCGIEFLRWEPRQIEMVKAGEGDAAPLIQAFARFERDLTPPVAGTPAEVREALEPFANYAGQNGFGFDNHGKELPATDGVGWVYLTIGDFRRARAALTTPATPADALDREG